MPKVLFQYISLAISATHAINGVAFRCHEDATSMTIIETNFVLITEPNHIIISDGGVSSSLVICGV